jgi:hypothetical protein
MDDARHKLCTAFDGPFHLTSGSLRNVALSIKRAIGNGVAGPVLVFDDATGAVIDLDLRGSEEEVLARLTQAAPASAEPAAPRGPGRPKLGVVAREVTLLPRHWEWLGAQPGGASVALRKLVEAARRANAGSDQRRVRQEAAYRFMAAIAGDLPGFEEAARALFADDRQGFVDRIQAWPPDIRDHAVLLAFGADQQSASPEDGNPV